MSWRYDTNDNLIHEPCVTPFPDKSAQVAIKSFESGEKINQYNVIGVFNSFEDAKKAVDEDLEKFQDIE